MVDCQRHALASVPPGRETRYPLYRVTELVWISVENFAPPPPVFTPLPVQPVSSRYTGRAIPVHTWSTLDLIMWSLFIATAGDQRVWVSCRLMNSRGGNRKRILLLSHLVHRKFPMKSPRIEPHSLWWKLSTIHSKPCVRDHSFKCSNSWFWVHK